MKKTFLIVNLLAVASVVDFLLAMLANRGWETSDMFNIRFTFTVLHVLVQYCKYLRVEDLEAADSVDHSLEIL